MFIMRSLLLSSGLILLLFNSVQAEEVDRGQLLYENHCASCHLVDLPQRKNRKVNSLTDLNKMVVRWQYHLKLGWSINDVRQVTSYLNQRFYKIPARP